MKQVLPQQCPVPFLYLTWILYLGGLGYLLLQGELAFGAVWLVVFPLALWAYVSVFPGISHWLGYGRVADEPADGASQSSARVKLYTALGCPFCPIVEERVRELQGSMGFELEQIDASLKPDLVVRKAIRSVPVVEVEDRRITGHATSRELVAFITGEAERALSEEKRADRRLARLRPS